MALRISPSPVKPGGGGGGGGGVGGAHKYQRRWNSSSVSVAAAPPTVSCCSLKNHHHHHHHHHQQQQQRQRRKSGANYASPPLHAAEELASRLGLEMAVAELERLFRQRSFGDPPRWGGDDDDGGGDGDDDEEEEEGPSSGMRVAYQGARGSYCQEAAAACFPSAAAHEPCAHMEAAFSALEEGSAQRAVVPLENSLDGPIPRNLDLLLRHPSVRIAGELVLPVNHCLLSHPSAPPSSLRRVVSHPQALAHCRAALRSLGLSPEEAPCAADAARLLARGALPPDTAVVGSRAAAREFGLRLLRPNLQDRPGNVNRFLQLALVGGSSQHSTTAPKEEGDREKQRRKKITDTRGKTTTTTTTTKKTTVAFALRNGPSELFRAMWILESRGVRVARVDHRPNRSSPVRVVAAKDGGGGEAVYMDYVFVLDVEGAHADVAAALASLDEVAAGSLRVLGSYTCTVAS